MPKVIINEIDRTQYNVTSNESDNIVYVPGSATTGPFDKPYLCRSITEFTSLFGIAGPNADELTISSWEYAINLLNSGFPVLFRRIVGTVSDEGTYSLSEKASYEFTDTSEPAVTQFTVTAINPGSIGNSISVTVSWTYVITEGTVTTPGSFKLTVNSVTDYEYSVESGVTEQELNTALGAWIEDQVSEVVKFTVESGFTVNAAWNNTTVKLVGGTDPTDSAIMAWLASEADERSAIFDEISDKDLYDVKFLTLGGKYAEVDNTAEQDVVKALVRIACEARRDCLAVLDLPYTLNYSSNKEDEVPTYFDFLAELDTNPVAGTSYACTYDPWFYFRLPIATVESGKTTSAEKLVCGSFIFLYELAKSLRNMNPIWLPPAGVNRGLVPEATNAYFEVGSVRAEYWSDQPRYVNPIRKIRNYGYAIFGQKTLYKVDGSTNVRSAFQDLSVRITANEIKRKIRDISISLSFENNNLKTWNEFRAQLDPYLMSIAADGALDNYKIIMDNTTTTEDDVNNNTVRGTVIVQIARAAENFNIDFIVTNSTAEFAESYS